MKRRQIKKNKQIVAFIFCLGVILLFLIPTRGGLVYALTDEGSIIRYKGWKNISELATNKRFAPALTEKTQILNMSQEMQELNFEHGHVRIGNSNEVVEDPHTLVYPTDKGTQFIEFINVGTFYNTKQTADIRVSITPDSRHPGRNPKMSWIGISGSRFLDIGIEPGSGDTTVVLEYRNRATPTGQTNTYYGSGNYTHVFTDEELQFIRTEKGLDSADTVLSVDQNYEKYDIRMPTILTTGRQSLNVHYMMKGNRFDTYEVQRQFTIDNTDREYRFKLRSTKEWNPSVAYPQVLEYGYADDRPMVSPVGNHKQIRRVTTNTFKDLSYEFTQIMPVRTSSSLNTSTEWKIKLDQLPDHLKHGNDWMIKDNAGINRTSDFNIITKSDNEYSISIKDNAKLSMYGYNYTFTLPIEFTDTPVNIADLEIKDNARYLKAKGTIELLVDGEKTGGEDLGKMSTDINVGYQVKYRYLLESSHTAVPGTNGLKIDDWGYIGQAFKATAPDVVDYTFKKVEPTGTDTTGFTLKYHPTDYQEVNFYYDIRKSFPAISWEEPKNPDDRTLLKNISLKDYDVQGSHKETIYVNTLGPNDVYRIVTKKGGAVVDDKIVGPTNQSDKYVQNNINIPKSYLLKGTNKFTVEMFRTDQEDLNPINALSTMDLEIDYKEYSPELSWNDATESGSTQTHKERLLKDYDVQDFHTEDIYVNTIEPLAEYFIVTKKKGKTDIIQKQKVGPTNKTNEYVKRATDIPKSDLVKGTNEFTVEMFRTDQEDLDSNNSLSTVTLEIDYKEYSPDLSWNDATESGSTQTLKERVLKDYDVQDFHTEDIYVNTIEPLAEYFIVTKKKGKTDIIQKQKVGPTNKTNEYVKHAIDISKSDLVKGANEFTVEMFRTDEEDLDSNNSLSTVTLKIDYKEYLPDLSWNSPTETENRVSSKEITLDLKDVMASHEESIYVKSGNPLDSYRILTKKGEDIIENQEIEPTNNSNVYFKKSIHIPKTELVAGINEFTIELFKDDGKEIASESPLSTLTLSVTIDKGDLKFLEAPTELKWTGKKSVDTKGSLFRDIGNKMTISISDTRLDDRGDFSLWLNSNYEKKGDSSPFSLSWKNQDEAIILDVEGDGVKVSGLGLKPGSEDIYMSNWEIDKGILLYSNQYVPEGDYSHVLKAVWMLTNTENPE